MVTRNTWNTVTVQTQLLVLEYNTWNNLNVCKQMNNTKKNY